MSVPFDARPLTDPVDRVAVTAHAREYRASMSGAPTMMLVAGIIIGAVMLMIVMPMAFGLITLLAVQGNVLGAGLIVAAGVALVVFIVVVIVRSRWAAKERNYRLSHFANANHMSYFPAVQNPPLPGMIFNRGNSRVANQVVRGTEPRFVEFGNYQYETGSGKNRTTHHWGYVAVKLDVPLPHIVLDATGNNSFLGSNLPSNFSKDQRLSLEGNFNEHFALYCPPGYEADALYLFTPDVMARFIDTAAQLDVEIADDWLFFYTSRKASTLDVATWAWLFGAVGAVITKLDQWARWRDQRLAGAPVAGFAQFSAGTHALPFAAPAGVLTPPPGVAPQGRRLKTKKSWIGIIFLLVFVAINVLMRMR